LEITSEEYAKQANNHRLPAPDLPIDSFVWLNAKNITTLHPMKKLDHKRLGPFQISEKILTHAYCLDLPKGLKGIHNVFHVSILEPQTPNQVPSREKKKPPPIEVDGEEEFKVECILDSRKV
jgi:hypothetical protein